MRKDLDDADFVGNIEGVIVRSQSHVSLLHAIGTDERVHFGDVDLIKLLHRLLDLRLVGLEVDDENEGVVILNFLHRRLSREGIADDRIGVHAISFRRALLGELGRPLQSQSLGTAEFDDSSDLLHARSESAFDDLLLGGESLGGSGRLGHLFLGLDLLDGLRVLLGDGLLDLGRGIGLGRRLLGLGLVTRHFLLSFLARHDLCLKMGELFKPRGKKLEKF